MTFAAFIKFIEAVPALIKLVQTFVDKWQDYQYEKLLTVYTDRDLKRSALIQSIKKADTDDERKILVRMLYDITNPK